MEEKKMNSQQIEGRNAVMEAFRSGKPIDKVYILDGCQDGPIRSIVREAKKHDTILNFVTKERLNQISETGRHQGVIAQAAAYEYAQVEDMLELAKQKGEDPFLILLDNIEDPHNLGAIIRTANLAGAHGVIIPKHRAAGLTATVAKTSAGALLGASGCGKTTLLKSIAGLLETQEGDIRIDDTSITNLAPEKRGTVIVFQDLRLFPHMTVEQNISFSMDLKKIPKKDKQAQVGELLKAVQLEGFEKRKIREMSGGQRQRVALARALAADPKILLLDEPFSSLDENLRCEMADLVRKLHHEMGLTVVMVTHDKEEAMKVSDRIALMKAGEVLQYDKPERMFYHPESRAVADYMGQTNYIFGKVENGRFVSRAVSFETQKAEGEYELMVRPSAITLTVDETERMYQIEEVMFEGETAEILLKYADGKLTVWMLHRDWMKLGVKTGELVGIKIDERQVILFQK